MAFMLGLRIVSYGVVGAAAILTHETTKAYKERLYDWAREKFTSHGSPPQAQGPPTPAPTPTPTTTHNECDAATYQHSLDGDADLPLPQMQQQLTTTCKDDDVLLSLPQPQQDQRPTTNCKDDVNNLSHDQAVKTRHLIDIEFELKASSETSKDHDAVKIEGGAKHEQQAPRLHGRGAAFFFAKAFNGAASFFAKAFNGAASFFAKAFNGAAKSPLHGFFCWGRGLFEDKRWPTVRRVIAQIVTKIFLLLADNLFHYTFKSTNPVPRQFWTVIFNEVKRAFL